MLTVPQSISPTPSSDAVPGTPRVASPGSRATILSRGFKNKEAPRRSWLGGSVLALEGRAAARLPSTAAWPGPARGRGGWRRAGKARGPTALRPPPAPTDTELAGRPGPGARVSVTPAPSAPTDLRPIRPPQAGTASNAEATPREPPRPSLTSGFSGASETRETRLCRWRVPRCPRPRSAARRTPRASAPAEAPAVHSGSDFFTENGFERGGRSGINTDLLKRRSCLIPPPDSAADFTGQQGACFRPAPPPAARKCPRASGRRVPGISGRRHRRRIISHRLPRAWAFRAAGHEEAAEGPARPTGLAPRIRARADHGAEDAALREAPEPRAWPRSPPLGPREEHTLPPRRPTHVALRHQRQRPLQIQVQTVTVKLKG